MRLQLDAAFSHINLRNRPMCTTVHFHNKHELYYLVNGDTTYFIGDEIIKVEKGNFVFVPKGLFHHTDSGQCPHIERILVTFDNDIFDENTLSLLQELCGSYIIHIPLSYINSVEEILFKLEKEHERTESSHKNIFIKLYTLELITMLCRLKKEYKPSLNKNEMFIQDVSAYISKHYNSDLSLPTLGEIFSVSPSSLSRTFKSVAGIGINNYITYVRILNAQKLLRENRYSVTRVAELCGFNDSNYFSTVFKKEVGISPCKYSKTV